MIDETHGNGDIDAPSIFSAPECAGRARARPPKQIDGQFARGFSGEGNATGPAIFYPSSGYVQARSNP